jgi:hypothetical protein
MRDLFYVTSASRLVPSSSVLLLVPFSIESITSAASISPIPFVVFVFLLFLFIPVVLVLISILFFLGSGATFAKHSVQLTAFPIVVVVVETSKQ